VSGIVMQVYYVDQYNNQSALFSVVPKDGETSQGSVVDENALNNLFANNIGFRVECDVLVKDSSGSGQGFQLLKNVVVSQQGGIHDFSIWVPRPSSNDSEEGVFDQSKLDGDQVLVGFIGGVYPSGAVVLGCLPHSYNYYDMPQSVLGDNKNQKEIGKPSRKDGNIYITRKNGSFISTVDRFGNITFNTVEANRRDKVDIKTGLRTTEQDTVDWKAAGNDAPGVADDFDPANNAAPEAIREIKAPGGGDYDFTVKNNRRLRIEFQDNTSIEGNYNKSNPREFKEKGFIQIHKGANGNREIELVFSDDVIVHVRKFGDGNGSYEIRTEGNTKVKAQGSVIIEAADTVTIDSNTDVDHIILGEEDKSTKLATTDFVREVFLTHVHQDSLGKPTLGPMSAPGQLWTVVPASDTHLTNTVVQVKDSTDQVKGE